MEKRITGAIVGRFFEEFPYQMDVAIAGAGPSGMVAAYYLAKAGKDVVIFERRLSIGGGIWGGGMGYPIVAFQQEALPLLEEFGIRTKEKEGIYTANSVELATKLASRAMGAGVRIMNGYGIEDLTIKEGKICGVVINSSAIEIAGLHVDPLAIDCKVAIDATGHDAQLCKMLEKRGLLEIRGQGPMWVDEAERFVVENVKEVFPGLYITGMSVDAVLGGPRMGPIFGGMLLSGKRVAELIAGQ